MLLKKTFAYPSSPCNCSLYTSIQGYWKRAMLPAPSSYFAPTHSHSCRLGWASVYLVYREKKELERLRKVARLDDQQRVLESNTTKGPWVWLFSISFYCTLLPNVFRLKGRKVTPWTKVYKCFKLTFFFQVHFSQRQNLTNWNNS